MRNTIALLACAALCLSSTTGSAQNINQKLNCQGSGFQRITIPVSGWYYIQANGAQGGACSNLTLEGGFGARMNGIFYFQSGAELSVSLGCMGQVGTNNGNDVSGVAAAVPMAVRAAAADHTALLNTAKDSA